jgi:excisionase family DNA binding protein
VHTFCEEGKPVLATTEEHTMSTTTHTDVQDGILTIDQAAAYLAIPKATLYTWRTRRPGFGPRAVKFGGCLRYRRANLDAWVAERVETLDDLAVVPEQRGDGVSLSRASRRVRHGDGMGRGRPPTAVGTWGSIRTTRVREAPTVRAPGSGTRMA